MNVGFVINDLRMGGAERLVKDLAIRMQDFKSVEPIVIVADSGRELESELLENGVELRSLGVKIKPETIPVAASALSRELGDIDIVHSHLPFSHIISRLACARNGTTNVSTYHNVCQHKTIPKRAAERITRPLSDKIICVSDGVRQSYPNCESMSVIYNAINVDEFSERVSEQDRTDLYQVYNKFDVVYLNVGRCVEQKRQQDLIEAVGQIDDQNVHLIIVGEGPNRPALEKLVEQKRLSGRVTITGYVESIESYYAIADVFVSASSKEGLPTTHIEAMAARLPIVSTNIPGVTEIVDQGSTGYLYPVGRPDLLAKKMRMIANRTDEKFGENGFEAARSQFSIDTIAREHFTQYNELLQMDETTSLEKDSLNNAI